MFMEWRFRSAVEARGNRRETERAAGQEQVVVTSDLEEVQTGRVSGGLVRGEMRSIKRTRPAEKARAKEIGGKGEHGKKGRLGTKEAVQDVRLDEAEERVRMAPNMAAGDSHSQAMTDLEEDKKS